MSDNDPTRSAVPVQPTVTHAPNALTPSYQPDNATGERTPTHDATRAEELSAPPDVPGYDILGPLGEGGMGLVFRARERAFNRDVAVKVLKAKYRPGSPGARRFLEEANVTAQLQHPAIPPVHQIGELADGRPFLAMKLIKGDTLADLLSAEGVVRSRFVPAFAQVCHAVAYAHNRKVIHRDLKPANVMVGAFGEVLVMDWGLAKVLGAPEPAPVEADAGAATEIRTGREPDAGTQAGSVLGTPSYMAPEQAGGEVERIDERADVFGLGAVLCTILTGKPPYDGPSTESVRLKAIRGETGAAFERLDACGADAELIALCKQCLSAERDARPRDASEVARAVSAHLLAVEERAKQAELERVRAEERRKQRRVQRALAGAVLLLLAAGAVGAGFAHLWRTADERRAEAERLRGEAESAKAQVEFERERVAAFEYGATMRVAHQEWRDGNLIAMRALLDGTEPKRRGWEWNYLNRLHDPSLLTLKGHTGSVSSASFSADGKRIVTGGDDNTAKVWDAQSGAELLALKGHVGSVHSASFSPDGKRILTGTDDTTAKVWDAQTGAELLALKGHMGGVYSASFSADCTRIATGSSDKTAKVWDAQSGAELLTLKGHTGGVHSVSFSADGKRIVTGGWDNTAKVWDGNTGAELLTLKGHTGSIFSASFSADGTRVVTSGDDTTAKVWDAKSGAEVLTLKGHTDRVLSVSFSADCTRIVTASDDKTAKVWDAQSGAELLTLKGHTNWVRSTAFSADGTRIVTGSWDKTAKVWDAQSGAELLALKGHTGSVLSASFSADGARIATGSLDKTAKVWEVPSGKLEGIAKSGAELLTLKGHTDRVLSVSFSADGTRIVTGSTDKTAKVWEVPSGKPEGIAQSGAELFTLQGHTNSVYSASFSSDGTRIVTASTDNTAKVWAVPFGKPEGIAKSGAALLVLKGHAGGVHSASFSADGTRVLTGSSDKTAKVWEVPSGKPEGIAQSGAELLTLKGHTGFVHSASFSSDGTRIVTSSDDNTAKVWDAKSGAELLKLKGHTDRVYSASFSADGTRIVTASDDNTAKVWDAQSGAELLTLKGHTGSVYSASFSADGTRIVTASDDKTAKVWDSRLFTGSRPASAGPVAPAPRAK